METNKSNSQEASTGNESRPEANIIPMTSAPTESDNNIANGFIKESIQSNPDILMPPFGEGYIKECGMEWSEDRVGTAFMMPWKGVTPESSMGEDEGKAVITKKPTRNG
jgi:hypothetical protein